MLLILVIITKSTNKICVCNDKQFNGCPKDCYSVNSFQFEYKNNKNFKKEKEFNIYFYSNQKDFEFEIESSLFSGVKLTLFDHQTSKSIKIKYKYPEESKNKIISLNPNYQVDFPNIIPYESQSSQKNIKIAATPTSTPIPEPDTIPISVSVDQMEINGAYHCQNKKCDFDYSFLCGNKCWSQFGPETSFKYTFKGERFQIYGTYDPVHRKIYIYLDDIFIAKIDQNSSRLEFQLQYTSEIFTYGVHTIKVISTEIFEITKFTYWPSVKAKRINIPDFQRFGNWMIEMDNVGGYRMSTNGSSEAFTTFACSKFWVYGTLSNSTDQFEMNFGHIKETINEHIETGRKEGVLLYESHDLTYTKSNLSFKIESGKSAIFYCIYYISETIPISVPTQQMKITGKYGSNTNVMCPNIVTSYPCGEIIWNYPFDNESILNPVTIQYTFKGEKFQVYGTYDLNFGSFALYLDDEFITLINQSLYNKTEYALQYTSNILPYGEHTIKITAYEGIFEIYKFAYWPSIDSYRLNSTEILPLWTSESDKIGGQREYCSNISHAPKKTTLRFSKIWVYGIMKISIRKNNIDLIESLINLTCTSGFIEALVYESDDLPLDDYEIVISAEYSYIMLHCIYFTDDQPTFQPLQTPHPLPISVGLYQMKRTGDMNCNYQYSNMPSFSYGCPLYNLSSPQAYKCGVVCRTRNGNYEYTFKGVKFSILGSRSPEYHSFSVYIDGKIAAIVNENYSTRQEYVLLYTSVELNYGFHTIQIMNLNELFEIYKLVYWPDLNAIRLNSTEIKPLWEYESDGIGGLREFPFTRTAKMISINFAKIWVYSSLSPQHGILHFSINGLHYFNESDINLHYDSRVDGALVYESEYLPFDTYKISFSSSTEAVLYCLYYINYKPTESPTESPTKSPTESPSESPIESLTESPTKSPIESPTESPTKSPSESPIESPTESPTESPSESPIESPTESPTKSPSESPIESPTESPTKSTIESPIESPSESPTKSPSESPTESPIESPTKSPIESPTGITASLYIKSEKESYTKSLLLSFTLFSSQSMQQIQTTANSLRQQSERISELYDSSTQNPSIWKMSDYPGIDYINNHTDKKGSEIKMIVIICAIIAAVLIISVVAIIVIMKKKKNKSIKNVTKHETTEIKTISTKDSNTFQNSSDDDLNFWL